MSRITHAQREKVTKNIQERTVFNRQFVIMNALAAIIACYGLFANSAAVIIGAMVVALLLDPLMGMSLGLMTNRPRLVRQGLFTLFAGVSGVLAVSIILGIIHSNVPIGSEITGRAAPNILDLMIALAGGAAAAYATVAPRLVSSVVGVAIATALLPPLASAGILLARGNFQLAGDALLLVLVNIVAIQFAMSTILWLTGFRRVTRTEGATFKTFIFRNIVTIGLLVILTFVVTFNFRNLIQKEVYQSSTRKILEQQIARTPGDILLNVTFDYHEDQEVLSAYVSGPRQAISPHEVAAIESKLPASPDGKKPDLQIRYSHVIATDKNGQIYPESPPTEDNETLLP